MHGFRGIALTGFLALAGVLTATVAMLAGYIGARLGIWLVTMSLGIYGLALGLGVWADHTAERERLTPGPGETPMALSRRTPRYFGLVQKSERAHPEAPHDPRERVRVTRVGAWEVRVYADARAHTLVPQGLWQLQLWEPDEGLSVITPSRATDFAYEALSVRGAWKVRVASRTDLLKLIAREYGGVFVGEAQLAQLERWLVPVRRTEQRAPLKD